MARRGALIVIDYRSYDILCSEWESWKAREKEKLPYYYNYYFFILAFVFRSQKQITKNIRWSSSNVAVQLHRGSRGA